MNTHIIIPIEEIEETILSAKETSEVQKDIYNAQYIKGQITQLNYYLKFGKQISLDEKDIEEKVWSYIKPAENRLHPENSDGYNEFEVYQAVKQALKDLL